MNKNVENAVFFTTPEDLKFHAEPYQRAYFGHEFCQRLLPAVAGLKSAIEIANSTGKTFTLVTSFVSNAGLARVQELLEVLANEKISGETPEVVVNDWGVLHLVHRKYPHIPIVLGRLLTKQKRGPQILRIDKDIPESAVDHFRRSNVDVPRVRDFLARMNVKLVELDNLLQGISRNGGLPASLHYPFGYITTTRLCLLMNGDSKDKNLRSLGNCRMECRQYQVTLRHEEMPVDILLKGNTQFFFNGQLPENLEELGIKRLVYTPTSTFNRNLSA